jgi:hypothetical protein
MTFEPGTGKNANGWRKPVAAFAAALILVAQLLAVSHYHQTDPVRRFNAQAQVLADDGLCPLCTLAFHLPLNPAAAPAIERPQLDICAAETTVPRYHVLRPYSLSRTRAPPSPAV